MTSKAEIILIGIVVALLIAVAFLALEDDGTPRPGRPSDGDMIIIESNGSAWVDAETGCVYLIMSSGALTPRLDEDGEPVCGL